MNVSQAEGTGRLTHVELKLFANARNHMIVGGSACITVSSCTITDVFGLCL